MGTSVRTDDDEDDDEEEEGDNLRVVYYKIDVSARSNTQRFSSRRRVAVPVLGTLPLRTRVRVDAAIAVVATRVRVSIRVQNVAPRSVAGTNRGPADRRVRVRFRARLFVVLLLLLLLLLLFLRARFRGAHRVPELALEPLRGRPQLPKRLLVKRDVVDRFFPSPPSPRRRGAHSRFVSIARAASISRLLVDVLVDVLLLLLLALSLVLRCARPRREPPSRAVVPRRRQRRARILPVPDVLAPPRRRRRRRRAAQERQHVVVVVVVVVAMPRQSRVSDRPRDGSVSVGRSVPRPAPVSVSVPVRVRAREHRQRVPLRVEDDVPRR
eukprot:31461-Pelagococcus_subviridis.AAC.16